MLPQQAILEYKQIYKEVFGKCISNPEAEKQANRLLSLFEIIYKPISENEIKKKK